MGDALIFLEVFALAMVMLAVLLGAMHGYALYHLWRRAHLQQFVFPQPTDLRCSTCGGDLPAGYWVDNELRARCWWCQRVVQAQASQPLLVRSVRPDAREV